MAPVWHVVRIHRTADLYATLSGSSGLSAHLRKFATNRFTIDLLGGVAHSGLATAEPIKMRASGKTIEVARVAITEAGRKAIEQ